MRDDKDGLTCTTAKKLQQNFIQLNFFRTFKKSLNYLYYLLTFYVSAKNECVTKFKC